MRLIPTDTRNILIGLLFNLLKLSKKMCFFPRLCFFQETFDKQPQSEVIVVHVICESAKQMNIPYLSSDDD